MFRVALNYCQFGIAISYNNQKCPKCFAILDKFGDHAVGCSSDGGRIFRHDRLRDVIFNYTQKAALCPVLEKRHLSLNSSSKPADVFLPSWISGRAAALDVTVISSLQNSTVIAAGAEAGAALKVAENRKISKHSVSCAESGITFLPLAVEVLGGWSAIAVKNFEKIAKMAAARSLSNSYNGSKNLFEQLSVILQKGNAHLIISRHFQN